MKGYLRKAGALLAVKEFRNAQEAYRKALELDPNCQVSEFTFRSKILLRSFIIFVLCLSFDSCQSSERIMKFYVLLHFIIIPFSDTFNGQSSMGGAFASAMERIYKYGVRLGNLSNLLLLGWKAFMFDYAVSR